MSKSKKTRKNQKMVRYSVNLPWSTSVPLALAVGVPLGIIAWKEPKAIPDSIREILSDKWSGQFWFAVSIMLLGALVGLAVKYHNERLDTGEYIKELEDRLSEAVKK